MQSINEREVISERTKQRALRIKNEGKPLGNLTNLDVVRVRGHATIKVPMLIDSADIKDIIEGIKLSGVNTLQGILLQLLIIGGVKTYNDRVWYPTTIKNVMERYFYNEQNMD